MKRVLLNLWNRVRIKHQSDRGDADSIGIIFIIAAWLFMGGVILFAPSDEDGAESEATASESPSAVSMLDDEASEVQEQQLASASDHESPLSMLDVPPESLPSPAPTVTVTAEPEPVASEEVEAAPVPTVTRTIDYYQPEQELAPMNWTPLLYIFGGLVGLAALGGGGFFALTKVQAWRENRAEKKTRQQSEVKRWDTLRARYDKMLQDITAYETDIHFAIKYPAMNDPLEPATAAMLEALEHVEGTMHLVQENGVGGDNELYYKLSDSLNNLAVKFSTAENNAKRVALSKVSDADRRDFRQAELLLRHISDMGNPPKTRANYAARLKKIVDSINERNSLHLVPDTVVQEIQVQRNLALTAAGYNEEELTPLP